MRLVIEGNPYWLPCCQSISNDHTNRDVADTVLVKNK